MDRDGGSDSGDTTCEPEAEARLREENGDLTLETGPGHPLTPEGGLPISTVTPEQPNLSDDMDLTQETLLENIAEFVSIYRIANEERRQALSDSASLREENRALLTRLAKSEQEAARYRLMLISDEHDECEDLVK